ncbi:MULTISPECIES: hypothetical protein [Burkholderia cepacia complex]|uniref:Morphogenetic protein n=1 Tax=Burkholderia ubonensis TaxID=101571 RepID=A0A1B4LB50_9BURK|nr:MULTISPECIES: hypothetical protein [Burkholderia cepacia complex]AOJ74366.1 hypothetical protein WJ35_04270 [Burkholderia ubonensis]AOK10061.1 hypothetical protein WK31_07275 [Burkholderia vietnamiensis]KVE80369.1 hypothetical protein WJ00_02270 [Burkholderia vietnamiensis]MBR8150018.1 hypothetical protein [Burkholderia vietnamiensis]MCA8198311.1 hypothetical protein [Burkholderia vietnamiensis]
MTERPILFSGPMVRAILEGRKTQTRRIIKLPHNNPLGAWEPTTAGGGSVKYAGGTPAPELAAIWHTRTGDCYVCPHGDVGDRLWVRETHEVRRIGTETFEGARPTRRYAGIAYQADDGRAEVDIDLDTFQALDAKGSRGWTPSIHMPRWASRITLEIRGVRAERLQSISEADAIAEGIDRTAAGFWSTYDQSDTNGTYSPRLSYQCLWDGINAARGHGWDANPWVWVVEFRKVES